MTEGRHVREEHPAFRFSRIGPKGPQLDEDTLRELAVAMTGGGVGSDGPVESEVPAGYTYLGQFVAHDLTFDAAMLQAAPATFSAEELRNARSPSLDLDCLYARGPEHPGDRERFYGDGARLRTGGTQAVKGVGLIAHFQPHPGYDLPRALDGTALIPDLRNDENLMVAQTHAAFIRFHNRIVDALAARDPPPADLFGAARELVVGHYQWMIRHDFLPRIVSRAILDEVFAPEAQRVFDVPRGTMPLEFSVAAYRLGHSMVRATYGLNGDGEKTLRQLFEFSGRGGGLSGEPKLPSDWIADLRRFYDFGEAGRPDLAEAPLNVAHRIDTRLTAALADLPTESLPEGRLLEERENLAFRNLARARMLELATGQQMARLLPATAPRLTPDEIREGDRGAHLTPALATAIGTATPLWFYVLREAELGGGRLRGVGGRLVAETFRRAMEDSRVSILRDEAFLPHLAAPGTPPPPPDTFRMVDLLLFAFEGRAELLNPLGG